jgi:hypothetical protein
MQPLGFEAMLSLRRRPVEAQTLVLEAPSKSTQRDSAIRLIAETMPLTGYRGIRADLPGWDLPEVIHGAVKDHRPCLSCEAPKPVFVDVLALGAIEIDDIASRWQLFSSAAELSNGEFHVVVPRWLVNRDGRQIARQLAELVGVRLGYIWAI